MSVKIVLADDHHVVRQGLRALLDAEPTFEVVGECADGLTTLEMVESLKPDVLIVDIMMPRLGGLEVARQVSARHSSTRIIMLSMHANEGYVLQALRNGASGYVLKDSNATDLAEAVRTVLQGRHYLSAPLSERAITLYMQKAESSQDDPYETLTAREREVLQLAAEGLTNNEIGERLFISPRTVEVHRSNTMRKLELSNQTDLIRYAIRRGILPLDG